MNDLRFAFRQLLKNPGFTAVAVLTLALGIGANTAMFSLVNGVLLKPLPYPDSDRLVWLSENQREQGQDFVNLTAPGFTDWRTQSTVFEDLAAYQPGGFDLTGAGDPARLSGIRASASLFPLLRVQPELGRGFTEAEDTFGGDRVAVIAHRLWQERFEVRPMRWAKASRLTATVTPSSASCRTVFGSRGSMPTSGCRWRSSRGNWRTGADTTTRRSAGSNRA